MSWQTQQNVLYIDNPVGTGFSFTDNDAGYARNQIDVGTNLLAAMRQFFKVFRETKQSEFYIAGVSYAGKYVPALGYSIHQFNKQANANNRINLKGLSIGDGVVDPINQMGFGDNLYQLGFIDRNALEIFRENEQNAADLIEQGNFTGAAQYFSEMFFTPNNLFFTYTGFTSGHNYLKPDGYTDEFSAVTTFMNSSGIGKRSLHVGNNKFSSLLDSYIVIGYLANDTEDTVAPWLAELIDNYEVFIYNGQLDVMASPVMAENFLWHMNFQAINEYKAASRNIWRDNDEIAGYYKKAGRLTQIVMRLAGHLTYVDQPKWTLDVILKLTLGSGFE